MGNNLLPVSVSKGSGDGALTATTAYTYDDAGNLTYVDGPLAGTSDTTRILYNANRETIGVIGPDPDGAGALKNRAQRITIDPRGLVARQEGGTTAGQTDPDWAGFAAAETVDILYDSSRRPVTRVLSSGGTSYALTQTSYDAASRVDCTATRMNPAIYGSLPASACTLGTQGTFGPDRITKTLYDNADQVTQVQAAFGTTDQANERTLTYTNNGRLQTLKDAENNLTTYEYDGFDRLSKTRMPNPTQGSGTSSTTDYEQLTYDAASNLTNRRLRDAQNIGFTYDNLNRVTLKNLPGTEPDVTYVYDNLGRLTSASQTGNALSFTYDALSRNLTQVGPQGTVSSQWDIGGRRTKLTYPGSGLYVDYDYLVTGETTKIRENGATTGVGVLATYGYDDLGRRTSLTFGNGVVQNYTYDPVSRLASLANDLANTVNDLSVTFAYNPASQIASTTRTGDAYAWTGHFNENKTGTPNGLNQLTQVGTKSLTHDARGNVTAFGTKSFTYSSENLLLTGPGSTTLAYDSGMRLYQVTSGGTTRFAYDALDRIAEYDGSNALQRRYVHGPGIDEPIVWYEGSGTTDRRFLSSDERGSIVSATNSAGALLSINSYDEYGQPQSTNLGIWGYTGQVWLPSVGLYYYKAREYDPELGRFLQTDPIELEGGPNLYAYVLNDPINYLDPLGLKMIWVYRDGKWVKVDDGTGERGSNDNGGEIVVAARRLVDEIVVTARRTSEAVGGTLRQTGDILSRTRDTITNSLERGLDSIVEIAGSDCGCLEAGTFVATPDGLKPIELIDVGDMVLAVDEITGKVAVKPVISVVRPEPKLLFELELRDSLGESEMFRATDDHPWKVQGKGWVETAGLIAGDRIDSGTGPDLLLTHLAPTQRVERTYNIEVADLHTFMVGAHGVIVHNVDCKKRIPGLSGKEAAKNAPSWARGEAPRTGESGRDFAKRLMDMKYGPGNYRTGPGTEFSKIQKYGDRGFR